MKSILTIDGIDGSGKSTFCRRLHEVLTAGGVSAIPIRVDDFRRSIAWDLAPVEATAYYDAYYDLAACDGVLRAFLAGERSAEIPIYDIATERRTGTRPIVFEGATVAVIEGVFPLRMPTIGQGALIYLETTEAEARRRILSRDLGKGRTRAEIERRIDRRYFPSQRIYREQFSPRDRAAVIVDNERPVEPRGIKRDLGGLPPQLQQILAAFLPSPDER
jgi:uridine kinase